MVYFEALKRDLPSEIDRISAFLGVALTPQKRAALIRAVGFDEMRASSKEGSTATVTMRKGEIGDWRNHLSREQWAHVDAATETRLSDVMIAAPLLPYHRWVEGP